MTNQYKAVIFDLDGTLANTIDDLGNSMNFALEGQGIKPYSTDDYKRLVGMGWENLVKDALGDKASDEKTFSDVRAAFEEHHNIHYMDNTVAYDGICELIDQLIENNIAIGIVTNKRQYLAEKVSEKLFGDKIKVIYGPNSKNPTKPDPFMLVAAMKELNVLPSETIFVGDTSVDIETSKAAKTLSVGVLWGFRTENELLTAGADHIISHPLELLKIISL